MTWEGGDEKKDNSQRGHRPHVLFEFRLRLAERDPWDSRGGLDRCDNDFDRRINKGPLEKRKNERRSVVVSQISLAIIIDLYGHQ